MILALVALAAGHGFTCEAIALHDVDGPIHCLDEAFEASLPGELAPYYVRWNERRPARPQSSW